MNKELEKYIKEQSLSLYENEESNGTYRQRLMFENGYGVILLEDITDNQEKKNTWNVFVIQKDEYDPEQGIDYIFRYDTEIKEEDMRNVTVDKMKEIIETVKNWNKEEK